MDRIELHNKAFQALCWLKHNCNATYNDDLKRRDSKVEDVNKYITYLENRVKKAELANAKSD